jgi:C4-type Zn-finger protein
LEVINREANVVKFVKNISLEVEKCAYLVLNIIRSSFTAIWAEHKENDGQNNNLSNSVISKIEDLLQNIKETVDFIVRYREVSNNQIAFQDENTRMQILY